MTGDQVKTRRNGYRAMRPRLGADDGSALILALVFLTVFAVLATLVADLSVTTFKASEVVSDHGDSLFGADDTAERVQAGIQTPTADPVCDLSAGPAKDTPYAKDGKVFKVRCSWLKEGDTAMPGYHLAVLLMSTYPDALVNLGKNTLTAAVPLSGNIRLNTDMVCFRAHVDQHVAPCNNRPDMFIGNDPLGRPMYGHVGPIDLRADSEGTPSYIEIPKASCPVDGSWLPNPVDYAGARHNPAWDGPHLRSTDSDGNNPQPFTADNWKCRDPADPEYDLEKADPKYRDPVPDISALPLRDRSTPNAGAFGTVDCTGSDYGSGYGGRWDAPTLPPHTFLNRVRHSCIRWFEPGRYTYNPTLDLSTYSTPTGSRGVVRANVFKPGLYLFDSDGPDYPQPWFPDSGVSLYVRDKNTDAPIVMGTVNPTIVSSTGWNNEGVYSGVPIDQRCIQGDPGVQMVFNPGYGVSIQPNSAAQPAPQIAACHLQAGQVPGATPGVVLYQRPYDEDTWEAGFSNWPNAAGQHVVTRTKAPAWGTFALFNSNDIFAAGGLYLDGTIYAPHGLVQTAVGSNSAAGTHMASGMIAWGLHTKGFGTGGQLLAGEQPTFVNKMQVEIWDCGAGAVSDTAFVTNCGAGIPPDATAIVDAPSPGGAGNAPTQLRFDRWLPS